MNGVTKKWVFLKASSVILIPLMAWFIINLVSIFDKDYFDVLSFFLTLSSKILFSLLLIFAFFFSNLSISEVFEDYIQDEKTKSVANNILKIFAIIVPLITIITLFNLKI
jgi:succinate dehydrogenase / fumarate reductase membrane anchor subunit